MLAPLYEEMWRMESTHWWFVGRRRVVRALVERYSPRPPSARLKICELGCGTGGNLVEWMDQHEVAGMEPAPEALEFARRRLGDRVQPGSLPDVIPFPKASFDVVLLTDVFEHVEDDASAARAALGLLKPGGILVATVPAYQWLYSPRDRDHQHFRRYSKKRFRSIFNVPGAELRVLNHYNTFLFPPAALSRLWSRLFHNETPSGDLKIPPKVVNDLLTELFAFERHLAPRIWMPFGLSLVAVVRRSGATGDSAHGLV